MIMYDFYRVATAVPDLKVADVTYNKNKIIEKIDEAGKANARLIAFPELCLTGYTCGDLFFQDTLLNQCRQAIGDLVAVSSIVDMVIIIGAPIKIDYQLYNAGIVFYKGTIVGISLKTIIPNHNEFSEKRWFSSSNDVDSDYISINDIISNSQEEYMIPVGNNIIYNINDAYTFGVELCEDLWAPVTPSTWLAMGGAELIVNLSASNESIGKRAQRRDVVRQKSSSLICDYLFVSSGNGESTTDLVFSGHSICCENGRILAENDKLCDNDYVIITDIDLGKIRADRLKNKSFKDTYRMFGHNIDVKEVYIDAENDFSSDAAYYNIPKHPFIPSTKEERLARCKDIFDIQVAGLEKRLNVVGGKLVVGVSGGMDSTLALLVCAKTLLKMGKPLTDLVGITMPAFGTSDRTYNNSLELMNTLGITIKNIPIKDACLQHYKDIEHDFDVKDITFENVQARERTQVLMDYANKIGGLVVGTGDLSELALGWCTYNADQMSMYGVNGSIPKTLVKWMIDSVVEHNIFPESSEVLKDIIDTPISPELLPPDENGNIAQKTEEKVGPYELHDFFLYYMFRFGYSPSKIYFMAKKAFEDTYQKEDILKWMNVFYKRYFTQQFKRSCMPDGVKVGSVALSPRGDLKMPSDAASTLWLKEIESLSNE